MASVNKKVLRREERRLGGEEGDSEGEEAGREGE